MVLPDGQNVKAAGPENFAGRLQLQVFIETEAVLAVALAVVHGGISPAQGARIVEMFAHNAGQTHAAGQHVAGIQPELFQEIFQALFQAVPRDAAPDICLLLHI